MERARAGSGHQAPGGLGDDLRIVCTSTIQGGASGCLVELEYDALRYSVKLYASGTAFGKHCFGTTYGGPPSRRLGLRKSGILPANALGGQAPVATSPWSASESSRAAAERPTMVQAPGGAGGRGGAGGGSAARARRHPLFPSTKESAPVLHPAAAVRPFFGCSPFPASSGRGGVTGLETPVRAWKAENGVERPCKQ